MPRVNGIDGIEVCEIKEEPLYLASMPNLPEGFDGDDQPMVNVSWFEANAYCEFYGMKLPTEAQFERGARGLSGDREFGLAEESHYGALATAPVCSYPENDLGLCDMIGNVWEWTRDVYQDSYEGLGCKDPFHEPKRWFVSADEPDERKRSIRGSSWDYGWRGLRVTLRNARHPEFGADNIGFRCVASQDSEK